MSPFTGREVITIVRRTPGAPDRLGVRVPTETQQTVTGCSVQPLGTDEELSNVDRVITRWKLYAPAGTVLTVTDAVMSNGVRYEVEGDPQTWPDIRGVPHHVECFLRRATG